MAEPMNMGTGTPPEIAGFQQFEFALSDALLLQLAACLDQLEAAKLEAANVSSIPNGQGVYQLYLDGNLEYVGKTDTDAGLTTRLATHARKISGRPSLRGRVSFKAVQVLVFSAMDLETLLIRYYKDIGAPMSWQHSGFGMNDPGRQRDHTKYKSEHFDVRFPVEVDEPFEAPIDIPEGATIGLALDSLKAALPYNFRYDRNFDREKIVGERLSLVTARHAIESLLPFLPSGWQATKLPGYLILYPEAREYEHGEIIARS